MTIIFQTSNGVRSENMESCNLLCVFLGVTYIEINLWAYIHPFFFILLYAYLHHFFPPQKKMQVLETQRAKTQRATSRWKRKLSLQTGPADEPMVGIPNRSLGLAGGVGSWGRSLEGGEVWGWGVWSGFDQLSDRVFPSYGLSNVFFHGFNHNIGIPTSPQMLVALGWKRFFEPMVGWWLKVHPGRLTWNLQITHLERKMIFQTSMIMFHVNLPGCMLKFLLEVCQAQPPKFKMSRRF